MRLVIDSNEYIFAFGPFKDPVIRALFDELIDKPELHLIRIPRTIFEEVKRNLSLEAFKEFSAFINRLASVDEDVSVPFELGFKYETMRLKPADAFIASYTEFVSADALVTENRHFLSRQSDLPFKVLNAESCLKELNK